MFSTTFNCTSWYYHDKPRLEDGQELYLEREPLNDYDENAVRVETESGRVVGYVSADVAPEVSDRLKNGEMLKAFVLSPYEKEIDFPPVIQIQDEESIRKSLEERERTEKAAKRGTIVLATVVMLVICVVIGVVLGTLMSAIN